MDFQAVVLKRREPKIVCERCYPLRSISSRRQLAQALGQETW
jgi:hypothetical protein